MADQGRDSGQRHVGDVLVDSDGDRFTVGVLDHAAGRRPLAARLILTSEYEPADWSNWREREDECIAALAALLRPVLLRQHLTEPYHEHEEGECAPDRSEAWSLWVDHLDASALTCGQEERCCGCEDIGWWCDEGDGPPMPWFEIDRSVIDEALLPIYLEWMAQEDAS